MSYIIYPNVVDVLLTHGHMRENASWLIFGTRYLYKWCEVVPEKSERLHNAMERLLTAIPLNNAPLQPTGTFKEN